MGNQTWLFPYKGLDPVNSSAYEVNLRAGIYQFELWGGSGNIKAFGGYVKGEIVFKTAITVYLHVGSKWYENAINYSYGGGGPGQISGGGASDIRLKSGDFGDPEGLKSRIIVAAGAGSGDSCYNGIYDYGGSGGGLVGYDSHEKYGYGATQTSGGLGDGLHGKFGFGAGDPNRRFTEGTPDGNAGGGGGYFGGGLPEALQTAVLVEEAPTLAATTIVLP